jgi:molecular chaperone GrpE (heat shock protein)
LSHTNQFHQQEKAWLKVLNEFNSKNLQTKRTLEQVKAKFDNLKTKARKEVGEKKKHIKRTGGGPAVNYDLDAVTDADPQM